jgi:phage tail-like protein
MIMAKFNNNTLRFDPYRNFKYRVKWDNKYVAGLSKCGALTKTIESIDWREGGDKSPSRKLSGKIIYEAITLEAGVTHDPAFKEWANLANNYPGNSVMSLKSFRKDLTIDVFNEAGEKVLTYIVYRCWVSGYQALPELDASGNAVAIQSIKLEHEGWERDITETE